MKRMDIVACLIFSVTAIAGRTQTSTAEAPIKVKT